MDEKKELKGEEQTTEHTGEGDKSESTTLLDKANESAERLEAANAKREELLNRQELMMAKQALGGKSFAGESGIKAEESPEDFVKRLEAGELSTKDFLDTSE